MQALSDHSY